MEDIYQEKLSQDPIMLQILTECGVDVCTTDATEIEKLRKTMERILLDIKVMTEHDVLPTHVLSDFIYQEAIDMMTPEFRKEFENE